MSETEKFQNLIIFVPDLFWPEPDDLDALKAIQCPHLEKFLARTPIRTENGPNGSDSGPEVTLLRVLGAAQSLASTRAEGDGLHSGSGGVVLCADPVHLRLHHEQVVLADPRAFTVSPEEAAQLVSGLNGMFADIGEFFAPHPERWYVRLHPEHGSFDVELPPLSAVAGRRLAGDALHKVGLGTVQTQNQRKVRQWQNEIQMWLHAHSLNEARLAAGKPAINGLWFWGNELGVRSEATQTPYSTAATIYADSANILAKGLAAVNRAVWNDLPTRWSDAIKTENSLVIWDALLKPTLYEDTEVWRTSIEAFDREWLGPLMASKISFSLITHCIYGTFRLNSSDYSGWQFWKKIKPLSDVVQGLAQ